MQIDIYYRDAKALQRAEKEIDKSVRELRDDEGLDVDKAEDLGISFVIDASGKKCVSVDGVPAKIDEDEIRLYVADKEGYEGEFDFPTKGVQSVHVVWTRASKRRKR